MKYENYNLEDFLEDEYFIKWVVNPSADSNLFWNTWINNHPEKYELVLEAKGFISGVKYKNYFQASEDELIDSFDGIIKKVEKSKNKNNVHNILFVKIAVAASVVFLLFYTSPFSNIFQQEQEMAPIEYVTKTTTKGQKLNLTLGDGSKITLNSESQISFPEKFIGGKREIILTGEAFFKVTKDSTRPFIIHSQNLITTVLGTSFNIKAYQDESEIEVTVITGKVRVESKDDMENIESNHILLPNDMLNYNKEKRRILKERIENTDHIAWKENTIFFDNKDFDTILKELERWYNVEFIFENNVQVTGTFSGRFKNKSLQNVLEGLSFSTNVDFRIEGQKVYFFEKGI